WASRKLEYGFVTRHFRRLEVQAGRPLRVLDAGCGVVPLGNWAARRGHQVLALDPCGEDIEFLVNNNLDAFYGSDVSYMIGRCEELPFASATFDVVTCASVLEHVAPGNDRPALGGLARVLKPGGHLLLTFDVAPPPEPRPGERPWPAHRRRFDQPFTPEPARRLLQHLAPVFAVGPDDLPPAFLRLTWRDVHNFWSFLKEHDGRDEPFREYLAVGAVLQRRDSPVKVSPADVAAAHREAQD